MFEQLRSRARNSDIDFRLLVPLLVNSLVVQTVVAIVRITTSYRAVELGLSVVWLGAISAAFAILPIFMAVSRCGTLSRSISRPTPPRAPISQLEQVRPAAPIS